MKHLQTIYAELDYLTAADVNLDGAIKTSSCNARIACYRTVKVALAAYIHVLNRQLGKTHDSLPQDHDLPPTSDQGPVK